MKTRTIANYFDGRTSKPQSVEVYIESGSGLILVCSDDEKELWVKGTYSTNISRNGLLIERKDSGASLRIEDRQFIKAFEAYEFDRGFASTYHRMIHAGSAFHAILAVFILLFIGGFYFLILPKIAEKAAELLPVSYDKYLSQSFLEEYLEDEFVNEKKTHLIQSFADELVLSRSHDLSISVVESGLVNAFALPDGSIVVFTGILEIIETKEELAALLSHEAVHVNERHSLKMICRNLSGYLFISLVLSDVNGIMAIIAENAHMFNSLSYSRSFEKEADVLGLNMMLENKISPKGMSQLLQHLEDEISSQFIPEFLSSHPVTENRIQYINELIEESKIDTIHYPELEYYFKLLKADLENGETLETWEEPKSDSLYRLKSASPVLQ